MTADHLVKVLLQGREPLYVQACFGCHYRQVTHEAWPLHSHQWECRSLNYNDKDTDLASHRLVSADEQRFQAIEWHFDQLAGLTPQYSEFITVHMQDGGRRSIQEGAEEQLDTCWANKGVAWGNRGKEKT
jgi:hypothetical protein